MRQPTCVIYVRLSRDSDSSTSVASQTAACEEYAARNGWRVLFVAEDVDVSGASKLEDRPGMSRVLDALSSADYVLAVKVDRYARSTLEFSRLLKKAEGSGTTLVTEDGVLGINGSRFMANNLANFAEYERDMIQTRILASKERLRTEGRWLGGAAPYGYRIIQRDGGKYLAIDETAAAVLRDVADRLINKGATLSGIARDLNAKCLAPADHARKRDGRPIRGAKWSTTTLRDVLITPAVRGWLCQAPADKPRCAANLVPVLDAKGEPQRVGPELLDAATHDTVRALLNSRAVGRGSKRTGRALLLHIAQCSECGGPLYHQKRVTKGRDYSTYLCQTGVGKHSAHASNVVNAAGLEQQAEAEFLKRFGFFGWLRKVTHAGRDVQREVRETETAIDNLSDNLAALPAEGRAAQRVRGQIAELETKLVTLQAASEAPRTEWAPTGRSIADEWAQRDSDGRRTMLADFGATVVVKPLQAGAERRYSASRASVEFHGPAWWRDDPAAAELASLAADLEAEVRGL
ncbi:recombinase family protein [Streptomyces gossypiisoli]|uniref:recombinase family protein n=1 Tax=Streptomyces gossypiisoli TaxID=2748864 RepID=UPI0015DBC2C8|nr:recombinase family protein [Streptomyces gossypiisoli]